MYSVEISNFPLNWLKMDHDWRNWRANSENIFNQTHLWLVLIIQNGIIASSYELWNYEFSGELCVSKFSFDNQWYRAKVESVKAGVAEILYIDYGQNFDEIVNHYC